jgi:hypothetical protein
MDMSIGCMGLRRLTWTLYHAPIGCNDRTLRAYRQKRPKKAIFGVFGGFGGGPGGSRLAKTGFSGPFFRGQKKGPPLTLIKSLFY